MALLQAVVTALLALTIAPGFLLHFDVTPKVAVLLAGTAALLAVAARGPGLPRGPRLLAALLLLNAVSLAVSTAFSSNRALSLDGSTWRCFGAVAEGVAMLFAWLVALQATGRPDGARTVLRGIAIGGMMSAAYGMARPPGTLGGADTLAVWLLLTVFLSLALARMETHRGWRWLALMAAALALVAMALTGSGAAWLGLLAGGAMGLSWSGFRRPQKAIAAAAVVVICGIGFGVSPPGRQMPPLLWRDSLPMALKRPAAGYGPEVFLARFPPFESRALARADPDGVFQSPPNILLDALVSQGVPGLLVLCGLCAAGFAAAWRLRRTQPAVAGCLAAALAAGIVSQQFSAFTVPTAVLFLTTIALLAGLATEAGTPRRSVALAGAAPVLAVALLYMAVRLTMADHALALTGRAIAAGDFRAAVAAYQNYWSWHLPGPSADLWYSRSWMDVARKTVDVGVLEQAMEISGQAAERAAEAAEEPSAAWLNLAQIAALHNECDGTEANLRRAIAANPNWYQPHWMLAQQLRLMSRLDEAGTEAALALELAGGKHPEVARTLQDIRQRQAGSHAP
jgi:hypothetical protein